MTQTAAHPRKPLSVRLGTNPKTLQRKALEKAAAAPKPEGESLEDMFPAVPAADDSNSTAAAAIQVVGNPAPHEAPRAFETGTDVAVPAESQTEPTIVTVADQSSPAASILVDDQAGIDTPEAPAVTPAWSDADERAYQGILARRKAAGFQRRGRDVSAQRVTVGHIKPNDGTVVAAIVGIVADKGAVGRGELIDLMAAATFAHPKAKPSDKAWCTGYIQGAIRDGFLKLADDGPASGEPSPDAAS